MGIQTITACFLRLNFVTQVQLYQILVQEVQLCQNFGTALPLNFSRTHTNTNCILHVPQLCHSRCSCTKFWYRRCSCAKILVQEVQLCQNFGTSLPLNASRTHTNTNCMLPVPQLCHSRCSCTKFWHSATVKLLGDSYKL